MSYIRRLSYTKFLLAAVRCLNLNRRDAHVNQLILSTVHVNLWVPRPAIAIEVLALLDARSCTCMSAGHSWVRDCARSLLPALRKCANFLRQFRRCASAQLRAMTLHRAVVRRQSGLL